MIYELREYTMNIAGSRAYLERFQSDVAAWFERCGFNLVGAWLTYIGPGAHSDLVWLLQWKDHAHREEAFDRLHAEPGYAEYARVNAPHMLRVQNRFMKPTAFSPLK